LYAVASRSGDIRMGDKLATTVFWLIAGSLTIFGLVALVGLPFRSLELWQVAVGAVSAIVLMFGLRQCAQILRGKRRVGS
ncbi:hypothetical protein, partial [Dyella subtropica]|uniref:hypothetical protein n=1 Tax=Dyella subtropica TaxID=2992127 RepID=UPI0022518280